MHPPVGYIQRTIFVQVILLMSWTVNSEDNWIHDAILDGNNNFHVFWTPTDDSIFFKVEVTTKGYVGFGLSPHGSMEGGDIVIGWVTDGGEVYFQDRHGVGNTFPPMDQSQDWILTGGSENDTHTSLTFHRKLQTCDPEDMEIDGSTIRLIYAYSENDPESPDSPKYHGPVTRGAKSVMLLQPKAKRQGNFNNLLHWDVRSPNYTITSEYKSIYWCKIYKGPELNEKHHIIRIEPLIQNNNERFLHHLVLYECVDGIPEDLEPYVDHPGHQCYHPNMPSSMRACQGVFSAWGVGGEPMVFPEHVGMPLEAKPPKYYLLEIHYDNPALIANVMDESGFRIYYTPELREFDAGTFMIGAAVTSRVFIPPQQKEFTVVGHSSHECIGATMPSDGVKIIGVFIHAHLLGRHLTARHFRGNVELPPFADDRHYDFNYQEYHYFKEEVPFLPHDQFTMECVYDSSERSNVTFGGLETKDEMCLAFILYYPRIERFGCMSVATFPLVAGLIGAVKPEYNISNIPSVALPELIDHLEKMDWNSINVKVVENAMRYSPHQTFCYMGTGSKGQMQELVSYPKNLIPYKGPTQCSSISARQVRNENAGAVKSTLSTVLILALTAVLSSTVYGIHWLNLV